jgi:Zn ribbon nucleic-acid-binding protein
MKNTAKVLLVSTFGLCALLLFLGANGGEVTASIAAVQPTPPANAAANTAKTAPAPSTPANAPAAGNASGKKIPRSFTLGTDSLDSEKGEVAFDHDSHAFQKYSADGQSVMACVECHHTDQPKSALKPPLSTSERDQTLTLAYWQTANIKVTHCRDCHFQSGNVPEGKQQPKATYTEGSKSTTKTLDNQLAFHINCNTCHDAAAKLRPELTKKPGFAVSKDCMRCHKPIG